MPEPLRLMTQAEHLAKPVRKTCWSHDSCEDLGCRCPCHTAPLFVMMPG